MVERSKRTGLRPVDVGWLGLAAALVALVALTGPASAHNPALTVYEPAAFDGGLLALGEEGVAVLLSTAGEERWRFNLSAHVVQAPESDGELAVTVARNLSDLQPAIQAFDAAGPTWQIELGPPGTYGYALIEGDAIAAFTGDARLLEIDRAGELQRAIALPFTPAVQPAPAPSGGWLIADEQGTLLHIDEQGREQARTGLGGRPFSITTHQDRVYTTARMDGRATTLLKALDEELATRWSQPVQGLRIGGEPAILEERIVFATYAPGGARLVAMGLDGQQLWEVNLGPDTAGAASPGEDMVVVATNTAIHAYNPNGTELWRTPAQPRLASLTVHAGLVLPSGAEDTLLALDATNGTEHWTWREGTTAVPWTDEGLAAPKTEANGVVDEAPIPWPLGWSAAAFLAVAVLARSRRPPV